MVAGTYHLASDPITLTILTEQALRYMRASASTIYNKVFLQLALWVLNFSWQLRLPARLDCTRGLPHVDKS